MVFHLAEGLKDLYGEAPIVCGLEAMGDGRATDLAYEKAGLKAVRMPPKTGFSWQAVFWLLDLIRSETITCVHTHDIGPLIYAVLAKCLRFGRLNIVHTQHSFAYDKGFKAKLYHRLLTLFAAHLTVVDEGLAETYRSLGTFKKPLTVINGVPFPKAAAKKVRDLSQRQRLLTTLGHDESQDWQDAFWLISLARLHPGKGQDVLLEIWRALPEELRQKSVLLFFGKETHMTYAADLKEKALALPQAERIWFCGATYEPEIWLKEADLFLSGSHYEGMPLAPIEALAQEVPCFLSRIRGHEILAPWSHLFASDKPEETACQLAKVLRQGAQKEPRREEFVALFHRDAMVRKYRELYG